MTFKILHSEFNRLFNGIDGNVLTTHPHSICGRESLSMYSALGCLVVCMTQTTGLFLLFLNHFGTETVLKYSIVYTLHYIQKHYLDKTKY